MTQAADRSLLPPAKSEFVLLADTHYANPRSAHMTEFVSRRLQSERARYALELAAACGARFGVHLGDHVQSYPEHDEYAETLAASKDQLDQVGLRLHHVAGNTDVGDKPDPTSPARPTTASDLAGYEKVFGRSWYSVDEPPLHVVVVNSSLLNSDLPEAAEQHDWLTDDLARHHGRRIALFLHHPLYLVAPEDPGLGNYDSIGEPARGWLLELIDRHGVEFVGAGHSHFCFLNQHGDARLLVSPSTSFTRPGFGELFSSAPAPERGRDDAPKLGFHLMRVHADGIRRHFIRSEGAVTTEQDADDAGTDATGRRLITCVSADLPRSPLGVLLRHPLTNHADVPSVFPSAIRQPARNDYPLTSIHELGARHVRIPLDDLADPAQRDRLDMLTAEGVDITATHLVDPRHPKSPQTAHLAHVDTVEIVLAGTRLPDQATAELLRGISNEDITLGLGPWLYDTTAHGRELPRPRHAYLAGELSEVDARLKELGVTVDRVPVAVHTHDDAEQLTQLARAWSKTTGNIAALDVIVSLNQPNAVALAARSLLTASAATGWRCYVDPLVELDRTMDAIPGLLDRRCNPTPAFHVLRCLNTLLHQLGPDWTVENTTRRHGTTVTHAGNDQHRIRLTLPTDDDGHQDAPEPAHPAHRRHDHGPVSAWYDLEHGLSFSGQATTDPDRTADTPTLTLHA